MERYELPDGWEWVSLNSVIENHRGGVWGELAQGEAGYPVLRSTNMRGGMLDFSDVARCLIPDKTAKEAALKPGDIIVSKSSGSPNLVGLPALFESTPDSQTYLCSNFTMRIRPNTKLIKPKYLFRFLAGKKAESERLRMAQDTSGLRNLKVKEYLGQSIPLPPIPEQQRIIAKIESLFVQSRAAHAALERVPTLMAQFRRAVLASAFRGELVEPDPSDEPATSLLKRIREAREQSGYKKSIEQMDTSDLLELPEGWVWSTIEQLGDVSGGLTKNSKRGTLPNKLPYLRVANVYFNELDLTDVQEIGIQESELARTLLEKGDLLVVEGNGSIEQIGRVAVWDGSIEPCVHQNHIIKVRFAPTEISKYVLFWLLSTEGRDQITKVTSSTSGLYTLSLSKVSKLLVPLAPLALQSRIVTKIETLLAQADIIEQAASVSLRRAEQVDQSILARAFRGELG